MFRVFVNQSMYAPRVSDTVFHLTLNHLHLVVGSCIQKTDCFFSWLVKKQYLSISVVWLAVVFQWDFQSEDGGNGLDEACLSKDGFSSTLAEARQILSVILWRQSRLCLQYIIHLCKDVLAVLPTGFRNSLVYQTIPAVLEKISNREAPPAGK